MASYGGRGRGRGLGVASQPTYTTPEDAATRIQAQVRRQQASDEVRFARATGALNHMESLAESDRLEANKSFARTQAILNENERLQPMSHFVPLMGTPKNSGPLGVPGTPTSAAAEPKKHSLFQLNLPGADPVASAAPAPKSGGPGVPRINFQTDAAGQITVSKDNIEEVAKHFKKPGATPLAFECVRQLVLHSTELLRRRVPNALIEVKTPEPPGHCVVLGDTHGQLADLLWIFFKNGAPSPDNVYIVNGDIADRGKNAVEIFVLCLLYKLWDSDCLHINRGNHEDRSMNESYGFLDECVEKWGLVDGVQLYELFNAFFEHLPLFSVVDSEVFILHGGLWRYRYTIDQLKRANFRRPIPEPGNAGPAEALLFDSVWADPMEQTGYGVSARGQNIITWGPDVTKQFLQQNKLRLLVRSHEVPSSGHGADYHHGGLCMTVFTASNYCGYAGNLGAVLVLSKGEDDRVEEHWAPSLQELNTLEADAENAATRIRGEAEKALRTQRARRRAATEDMEAEVIRRVQEMFVKHKTELFEYWTLLDTSPRGVFAITAAQWREGCSNVVGKELPWVRLQEHMGIVGLDNTVHYVKFLTRYRVAFEASFGLSATGWERAVWSKIMETLLRADLPLREALAALDSTNNGMVSPMEFGRLLESCGVAISAMQARALLHTFAMHAKPEAGPSKVGGNQAPWQVPLWDVLARLQVSMPVTPGHAEKDGDLAKWAIPLLRPVAAAVLDDAWRRLADQDAVPEEWPAARLLAVWFEDADRSGNGYLECTEFVDALERLGPSLRRGGCPSDRHSLANLGKYCDVIGNGRINYFELLNGLTWEDSLGSEFERDMMESINASIFFNSSTIRRALQRFDPDLTKKVTPEDLVTAIRAVMTALTTDRGQDSVASLNRQQIQAIADNLPRVDGYHINYEKFLNSFRIVDTTRTLVEHSP